MKLLSSLLAFGALVSLAGCTKVAEPMKVAAWDRYEESYARAHFSYPRGWHLVAEGGKIAAYSSPDAVEKFYDPTSKGGGMGIQLLVVYQKIDTPKTLDQYVEAFKSDRTAEGYTIAATASRTIDGAPAAQIEYSGRFDENTLLQAVRVVAIKDSMVYYAHYGAFNEQFSPNRFLFDTLMASIHLYQPKPASAAEAPKPSEQFVEYSHALFQVSYPNNFEPTFPAPKGGAEFSLELRGYRQDCTIRIDVLPAKGLKAEKVVEQNTKFYKSKSRGSATIDGMSTPYLNYSPAKNIESRVYFLVKGDRVYRMIFNYFQSLKQDYLPAFEKTIASVRIK